MGTNYSRRNKHSSKDQSASSIYIITVTFIILNTAALALLLFQGYSDAKNSTHLDQRVVGLEEKVERIETTVTTPTSTPVAQQNTAASAENTPVTESSQEEGTVGVTEPEVTTTVPSSSAVTQEPYTGYNSSATETTPVTEPAATSHIVQSGDSLSLIAETYGVSVSRIMELNHLSSETVVIGQELILN